MKQLDSKTFQSLLRLRVREHTGDLRGIRHGNKHDLAKFALGFGRLRGEDMAHLGLAALELAGTSLLEALGRAGVCLQLWHGIPNGNTAIYNSNQYSRKARISGQETGN